MGVQELVGATAKNRPSDSNSPAPGVSGDGIHGQAEAGKHLLPEHHKFGQGKGYNSYFRLFRQLAQREPPEVQREPSNPHQTACKGRGVSD